ncbi:ATP-binding protein [Halospeciosus flavus]|uniref:histidine kinase n=1 Tax=Halospeciosus flavus TaxID=3032283 RepID=A0ABD5Z3I3_9EURY|nr:ATP-binding protein [Halospeciosus flavus]
MTQQSLQMRSPFLVVIGGLLLFLVAAVHHGQEIFTIGSVAGPVVALLVDGLPALGLAYAGYWLAENDSSPTNRWVIFRWCLAGVVLFGTIMGATLFVRAFEGRVITEPLFPLLVAINAGGIAGFVAGYYQSRARAKAHEAKTVSEAFEFVNSLIRHDLRNDLVVIRGHAGILDDELSSTDDVESETPDVIVDKVDEALTRIETSNAVAQTLVGDPDLETVDVADIAAEMASQLETSHRLTVTTDLPDQALVTANAGLRSVLDNVLENAADHNDADDPRIHVAIETTEETVRLSVADNGPGIPDDQRAQLFDPSGDDQGGLIFVGKLVEEYDGTVHIEDNEPRGTVFEVELPRAG